MSRRSVVWLLTLPLAVIGSQIAHGLAYRLAIGDEAELAHELAASGHGYLAYAPVGLAICVAIVVFALVRELQLAALARRPGRSRPSALSFAVLAPAIFVSQEYVERLVREGGVPAGLVLERTFALGLALQLPFALVAYVLARLLLRATHAVARLLAQPRVARVRARSTRHAPVVFAPRTAPTGIALGPRGPPAAPVV